MFQWPDALACSIQNPPRNANYRAIARHIAQYYRTRTDADVTTDLKIAQYFSTRTDDHIFAECRVTFAAFFASTTKRHALVNEGVIANNCRFTDDYSHPMIDEYALANCRARVNLNARKKSR